MLDASRPFVDYFPLPSSQSHIRHPARSCSHGVAAFKRSDESPFFTIVKTGGVFYYITRRERNPGPQLLPHDPSKKNVVVVGSGWASTAFLKKLDTAEYNVTVISPRSTHLDWVVVLHTALTGTFEHSPCRCT